MVVQNNPNSFQTSVEITTASGEPLPRRRKVGDTITLSVKFRDFLGGSTSDTGAISLSTTQGTLVLPNGGKSGEEIILAPDEAIINSEGEMALVLNPGDTFGKTEISVSCDLGRSALEIKVPAPAGFALAEIMESIIYAFMVAMVIRLFGFQTFWIPSGSMEPTLYEGDRIIANKLIYRLREPRRGEVVIFRVFQAGPRGTLGRLTFDEAYAAAEARQAFSFAGIDLAEQSEEISVEVQDYIKRVVGLPGDIIEVRGGIIYLNNEELFEDFETKAPNYSNYGPITVPPGEVFVLGDNRANSQDSHYIGTVPIRNIEGRAEIVFWPVNRIMTIPY